MRRLVTPPAGLPQACLARARERAGRWGTSVLVRADRQGAVGLLLRRRISRAGRAPSGHGLTMKRNGKQVYDGGGRVATRTSRVQLIVDGPGRSGSRVAAIARVRGARDVGLRPPATLPTLGRTVARNTANLCRFRQTKLAKDSKSSKRFKPFAVK